MIIILEDNNNEIEIDAEIYEFMALWGYKVGGNRIENRARAGRRRIMNIR